MTSGRLMRSSVHARCRPGLVHARQAPDRVTPGRDIIIRSLDPLALALDPRVAHPAGDVGRANEVHQAKPGMVERSVHRVQRWNTLVSRRDVLIRVSEQPVQVKTKWDTGRTSASRLLVIASRLWSIASRARSICSRAETSRS